MIPKIMSQEEVAVIVIIEGKKLKIGHGCPTFGHYGTLFRFLFRKNTGDGCLAKLELRLYPEEALGTLDKGTVERHAHISHLNLLDDIIFGGRVLQFYLVLEIEGTFGIVIGRHLKAGSHFGQKAQADALVKIE